MIDADVDFKSKHLKGRLGLRVRDVTFFAPKEVGWGPVFATSRFLHQRRSVEAPCLLRHVFCTKEGRLGPRVRDVTFFSPK